MLNTWIKSYIIYIDIYWIKNHNYPLILGSDNCTFYFLWQTNIKHGWPEIHRKSPKSHLKGNVHTPLENYQISKIDSFGSIFGSIKFLSMIINGPNFQGINSFIQGVSLTPGCCLGRFGGFPRDDQSQGGEKPEHILEVRNRNKEGFLETTHNWMMKDQG